MKRVIKLEEAYVHMYFIQLSNEAKFSMEVATSPLYEHRVLLIHVEIET